MLLVRFFGAGFSALALRRALQLSGRWTLPSGRPAIRSACFASGSPSPFPFPSPSRDLSAPPCINPQSVPPCPIASPVGQFDTGAAASHVETTIRPAPPAILLNAGTEYRRTTRNNPLPILCVSAPSSPPLGHALLPDRPILRLQRGRSGEVADRCHLWSLGAASF